MKHKSRMPSALNAECPKGLEFELSPQARERWMPELQAAAAATNDNAISILDPIGFDPWTGEGVTAKRIAGALRTIGARTDIVVNINSPGGDLFEGMAIYNMLREHEGEVTVKVLALAASAASLIAMAGDTIQIARSGFLMMHNTWVVAVGNRNDLRDIADQLDPFDEAMAGIYGARSGIDVEKIQRMMDAETWINGTSAVDQGFADALLPSDEVEKTKGRAAARAEIRADLIFAKAGIARSERRAIIQELKSGTPRAAGSGTPRATERTPCAAKSDATDLYSVLREFQI